MRIAATEGYLDIIKWLTDYRPEMKISTRVMDAAALRGHLEVVKWLHENRSEGCSVHAMDSAAASGHLDVVQWLHENRTEGCSTGAMDTAAAGGHLATVQWLWANREEGCTTVAVDFAIYNGHFPVVKWFSELADFQPRIAKHTTGPNNNSSNACIKKQTSGQATLAFEHRIQLAGKYSTCCCLVLVPLGQLSPYCDIVIVKPLSSHRPAHVHTLLSTYYVSYNRVEYRVIYLDFIQKYAIQTMPPLLTVAFVLEHQPRTDALQHLEAIICSFLGPAQTISLHEACTYDSTGLLDWIWGSSCTCMSERTCGWSLHNFLRSDELYNHWEFTESMRIAVSRGNLETVDWLTRHFSGCEVELEVVELAAGKGQLEMLKYLRNHENGDHGVDKGYKVRWGGRSIQEAITAGHYEIVRWLYDQKLHSHGDAEIAKVVCSALKIGGKTFAEFLLPTKNNPFDCVSYHVKQEWIFEFSRDSACAVRAFEALAKLGNLTLMQTILGMHSPLPMDQNEWISYWGEALQHACERGDLPMLRWLIDHPVGQIARNTDTNGTPFVLMYTAAGNGHVEILEHLTILGLTISLQAMFVTMIHAIRGGHLNVFKWMLEHDWCASGARAYTLINQAARYGRIEVLEFFLELNSLKAVYPTQNGPVQTTISLKALWGKFMAVNIAAMHGQLVVLQWLQVNHPNGWSTNVMNVAAGHGHLDVVKWLHDNRTEGCTREAMDRAAANGHFEVVEWLHSHRTEGLSTDAMDKAAANGHFKMVRWLHQNTNAGCTSNAMDLAAENGHMEIVKWLAANRSEGCTAKAIVDALNNGHLCIAHWLYRRFPHYIPTDMQVSLYGAQRFEIILYMYEQYPHLLTAEVVAESMRRLMDVAGERPNCNRIIKWLQEYQLSGNEEDS
ncbi:Hypothetical protein PHPALM_3418 [Phytophthora palmivora]|uniref:Uncharacterized protein n=1 Tax=Phytophthora palmivora TaxID=4796 RepID=A0A2P4YMF2_9STRA|nr:Hypothetical protein PHPALM_3418 [Phytophthora palmivora]